MSSFRLYLIRHGQSLNNASPVQSRVEDPGLTEMGQRQSQLLAERMKTLQITTILTSGFRRALETTRPLAETVSVQPEVWVDLHEQGGCYQGYSPDNREGRPGMSRDEIAAEFPEYLLPQELDQQGWWKSRPYETFAQATERADVQLQRLVATFAGTQQTVAAVIHADFKALLARRILGSNFSAYQMHVLANTGVSIFEFVGETADVARYNCVEHLPRTLVTV